MRATAIIEVVVVLPWVPITPIDGEAESSSFISAMRGRTSIPARRAARSSGWSLLTASEAIKTSTP